MRVGWVGIVNCGRLVVDVEFESGEYILHKHILR